MRVVAWLLDALITLFIALPFAPMVSTRVVVAIVVVALFIYRRVLGATPGEQIVGIQRGMPVTSTRRQLLRGLVGIVVVSYLGLTFCAGALISTLTNSKINSWRVDGLPAETTVPESTPPPDTITHQFDVVSFAVPKRIGGQPVEVSNCCLFFGGTPSDDVITPGVLVYVSGTLHPYDYCRGVINKNAGWLAGCGETPVRFQQSIFNATPASRWRIWNPIDAVRTNFALVAKNLYLEELVPQEPIRHFTRGSAGVYAFRGTRRMEKKSETANLDIDRFMIADGERYAGVDVVWKKVRREPAVVDSIASSLQLRAPQRALADAEL
ncbi:MAG: hypothetical protein ACXW3E_14400, partial [Thermoanaerobaculia bacterium]